MLKTLILGAAVAIAVPALAQTSGTANSDMNKPGSNGMTSGTSDRTSGTGATNGGDTDWGRTGTTATTSSSGTMGSSTSTSGSSAYVGQGGPYEPVAGARAYPPCSRSRTDKCTQMGGRHAHHRHR